MAQCYKKAVSCQGAYFLARSAKIITYFRLVLITPIFFLVSCASRGGAIPYDIPNFGQADVEIRRYPAAETIGPLDKLMVNVFQVEELSGEFRVDEAGKLTLPLVGVFEAKGLTSDELARQVAQRLTDRYMYHPIVQISVAEATPKTFALDGSVKSPGSYPLKGETTLMEAIAIGNGLDPDANPSRVAVFRTINGRRMAAAFDLQAIRKAQAEDPRIYGNDIIIVDGDRARAAFRDVLSAISVIGIFRPF